MPTLTVTPNLAQPDLVYTTIIDAHRGLTDEQSQDLNACLVLILANHIGDGDVIREAIALARRALKE